MLHAMAFHGGFFLSLKAEGDIEVDAHHLVEDTGLVLGQAFSRIFEEQGPVRRYGHAVIPMDDALSQVTIDACNRPYLVYKADFPQYSAGDFQAALIKEFLHGLVNAARINAHCHCLYGENTHHMLECLFKALGIALAASFAPAEETRSTKGLL